MKPPPLITRRGLFLCSSVTAPAAVAHAQLTHMFLYGGNRNITAVYQGLMQPGGGGYAGSNSNAQPYVQMVFGPTSAPVSVSGRVVSGRTGRGIFTAWLTITDSRGEVRYAMTNPFGHYRFTDLTAGETYFISVDSKNHVFESSTFIVTVNEDLTDMNFVSQD